MGGRTVSLIEAIIYKYDPAGHASGNPKQGLEIRGDRIVKWPYEDPKPKVAELAGIIAEYQPVLNKDQAIKESKAILSQQLENNAVEVRPGVIIKARTSDYINITEAIDSLEDGEVYEGWHQGSKVYDLTKAELQMVFTEGKKNAFKYHKEHSARIKAL
jgi:hypothetical protein